MTDLARTPAELSNYGKHIQALDSAHHLHPFAVHHELREDGPRVITRAEGVYLHDADGNRILDGMAGLWCTQLGYGVKDLADVAHKTMMELSYYNTFFSTTTPQVAELSRAIAEKTPDGLNQVFYGCSGSDANDSAIKLIWYYWNLKGQKEKKHIISRHRAYHGSTMASASLTGLSDMHDIFDLPIERVHHIVPTPHYYEYAENGESEDDFAARCAAALEEKILELGQDKVAAFIAEPVMGAGGLMLPPAGYFDKIRNICDKYNVLLWADEVICGFGRTGSWFGCQTFGFTPDLMTMAKGITSGYQPLSAVVLNDEIAGTLAAADTEMAHGLTYHGHPVACAVALRSIALLDEYDLIGERGKRTDAYFQEKLATLNDHPIVGQTRGVGKLGAIEIVKDKATGARFPKALGAGSTCRVHSVNAGLMMRAINDTMILSPPLVITESQIDELFASARTALDKAADDLAA
ncbi:MAG: aminotransferase [Pseudomonadota bacterium]